MKLRLLFTAAAAALLLTACVSEPPAEPPAEQPTNPNEFRLDKLPQLDPFIPFEEIGSEWYAEPQSKLLPRRDYGQLYPYIGQRLESDEWMTAYRYGLCTADGRAVTAAVYESVYYPGYDGADLFCLYYPTQEYYPDGAEYPWFRTDCVIAATDGSWVTEPFSGSLFGADEHCFAVTEYGDANSYIEALQANAGSVFLYDSSTGRLLLSLTDVIFFGYSEGVLIYGVPDESRTALTVHQRRADGSEYTSLGINAMGSYHNGISAARSTQNGLWGAVDLDFNWQIEPQYESLYYNEGNRCYEARLANNTQLVLDEAGTELFRQEGDGWIYSLRDKVNDHLMVSVNSEIGAYLYDLTTQQQGILGSAYCNIQLLGDGWYTQSEDNRMIVARLGEDEPRATFAADYVYETPRNDRLLLIGYQGDANDSATETITLITLPQCKELLTEYGTVNDTRADGFTLWRKKSIVSYNWDGEEQPDYEIYNSFIDHADGWRTVANDRWGGLLDPDGNWIIRRYINNLD